MAKNDLSRSNCRFSKITIAIYLFRPKIIIIVHLAIPVTKFVCDFDCSDTTLVTCKCNRKVENRNNNVQKQKTINILHHVILNVFYFECIIG